MSETCPKPAIEFFRRGVRDLEMHSRMAGADPDQQPDEIARRDRAHDAELQPRLRQLLDIERSPARRLRFVQDLVEVGLYDLSQFGKMSVISLAVKESPAKFFLEQADRARQRRLRDVAAARGPGEVQFLAERAEIDHLLHFHSAASLPVPWRRAVWAPSRRREI